MSTHYEKALEKSEQTYSDKLPNTNISDLIEDKSVSFHEIAFLADQAMPGQEKEVGTLIHRIAELRTLRHQSGDILAGKRFVELNLQAKNGGSGELDLVTVRGKKHYIHDYKPINIQEIQNKSWANEFNSWLTTERNGDYKQIGNYRSMPPELRANFKQFLSDKIKRHHKQLNNYRDAYSEQFMVPRKQIKTSVLPYFVNRL